MSSSAAASTSLKVRPPSVGFGTFNEFKNHQKVADAVRKAIQAGYRHFDLAQLYGNEEEIGKAINAAIAAGETTRERLYICSKLWCTDHAPVDVEAACVASLTRLGLTYLDNFMMHWPTQWTKESKRNSEDNGGDFDFTLVHTCDRQGINATWAAMEALVDSGLTKSIGVSNFDIPLLKQLLNDCTRHRPNANEIEMHPYLQQNELLAFCKENDVAVVGYSPLGKPGYKFKDDPNLLEDPVIQAIAAAHGRGAGQVALRWAVQRGCSVVPKSLSPHRIISNLDVLDWQLTQQDMAQLAGLDRGHRFVIVPWFDFSKPTVPVVSVVVTKEVQEEQQEEWLRLAGELAAETWKEAGCRQYKFVRNPGSKTRFVIVEEWQSACHLEAHFATGHFKRLVPLLDALSTTVHLDAFCTDALPLARESHTVFKDASDAVTVVVTKEVALDKQAEWLEMAMELAQATWQETGCTQYRFVKHPTLPTRFVIIEEWCSLPHLHAHFDAPHFKRLVPLLDAISDTPCLDAPCVSALPARRPRAAPCPQPPARMGRVLVLYDSSTNCTRVMAGLVADGARQLDMTDVRVRKVPGDVNHWDKEDEGKTAVADACFRDVQWADGVIVGTPTNLGGVSWRMKKFWDDLSQSGLWNTLDGKLGCSFSSQGGHAGGGELVNMAMNIVLMNFGFSVFGVTDYVAFKNTLHYGAVCAKSPRDELDQLCCRRLGLRMAEFVGYYHLGRKDTHPLNASKARDTARWGYPGIPHRSATLEELTRMNHSTYQTRGDEPMKKVLILTTMKDYQHESTSAAASWVAAACTTKGYTPVVTADSSLLDDLHHRFELIVLVNNSGAAFNPDAVVLKAHLQAGRGVLGVHACLAAFLEGEDASGAALMTHSTDVITDLFGTHFKNHPPVQRGQVALNRKAAAAFGGLASLPESWSHEDEFFNYTTRPGPDCTVLAWVDEASYDGGLMGPAGSAATSLEEHPVVWHRRVGAAQAPVFYCALGHFAHFYNGLGPSHVATLLEAGLDHCLPY